MNAELPPRTRAEQARHTRAQILEVAVRLFAARGFDGTSLQMIADELGVTKAAVYYHFRAKVDILRALLEPIHEQLATLLDAVETKPTRAERIDAMAIGLADLLISMRALVTIAANEPALRGRLKSDTARFDAARERSARAIYGAHPTTDELAAAYATGGLADVVAYLPDLDDETLRATLRRAYLRVLTVGS